MKKQIYNINQVLNLAETLNKIVTDGFKTTIEIVLDSDDDLKAITTQEGFTWNEPTPQLPCYWSTIKLGNVTFELEGIRKEITVTFN